MPPHVPRKRLRDVHTSPEPEKKRIKESPSSARKSTLYDDLDAAVTPHTTPNPNSLFTHSDDSSSSLSSPPDSDEFEQVPAPTAREDAHESSDEDDNVEFEDVVPQQNVVPDAPITGDLELNLTRDDRLSLTNNFVGKRGPSKRERIVRGATHRIHVQTLLWHNAIRNAWICDPQVQATMLSHLTPRLWEEVDRWRRGSGLEPTPVPRPAKSSKNKPSRASRRRKSDKAQDWSQDAVLAEEGAVDMSHGDPLFRLMQALSSWWRQRYTVATPGLRKWGYMPLERLDRITKSYAVDSSDPERFGERFRNLDEFRECAQNCRGSRDVGSQLFTALLRGLGLDSRMVANIQCIGFGWSKFEEAELEGDAKTAQPKSTTSRTTKTTPKRSTATAPENLPGTPKEKASKRTKRQPSDESELKLEYADTDDESVVDMQVTPKRSRNTKPKIDTDLAYPHYWTEVLSPVTNKYLPVDPIVKNIVATNRELVEQFEPRGVAADKARQVVAYVVGFSQDGTAKDVTVRYLKRSVFPGRTKGLRYPVEKRPVYDRRGKVARYDLYDWFKDTMSGYGRGGSKVPISEADSLEDAADLKPAESAPKQVKEGQETLQYYKQSQEFVLPRHLKREEALRAGAAPVKTFKSKSKGGDETEEDVFLRSDVLSVKSAETWHKQGRAPKPGEQPLKRVPYRAATTNRRREILEAESTTGRKVLQGLYSFDQTDWIIPDPIKNGVIPKNEYG